MNNYQVDKFVTLYYNLLSVMKWEDINSLFTHKCRRMINLDKQALIKTHFDKSFIQKIEFNGYNVQWFVNEGKTMVNVTGMYKNHFYSGVSKKTQFQDFFVIDNTSHKCEVHLMNY